MANLFTYGRNVARSVAYTTIDAVKDMNPALQSFADSNAELSREAYASIKDFKGTIAKAKKGISNNEVYKLATTAKNNLFEDLKTGNFYNRERIDAVENKLVAGDGDDWEFNDDTNFDSFDEDGLSDDFDSSLDSVGKAVSNAVAEATVRSADYVVTANRESTRMLYNQQKELFARVNLNMNAINSNIASLVNLGKPLTDHMKNSATFYKTSNDLQAETNRLLQQILKNQEANSVTKKKNLKNRKDYNYITNGGMVDIKAFGELIKDNMKSATGGIGDLNKMFGEGTSFFESMIASPISSIMEMVVKQAIPAAIKKQTAELNDSLSGLFGTSIAKFKNKTKDMDSGIIGIIKKALNIDTSEGSGIKTENYEKGKVDFDGIARKSIVEVIPTYLAKIYSAVSGNDETRYDYKTGQFRKVKDIKAQENKEKGYYQDSALSDLTKTFNEYIEMIRFDSKNQQKMFMEEMKNFYKAMYEKDGYIDYRNPDTDWGDYGLTDERVIRRVKEMLELNAKNGRRGVNLGVAGNVMSSKSNKFHNTEAIEYAGDSVGLGLINGSYDPKVKKTGGLFVDDEGRNIFFYLKDYYEQIGAINTNLATLLNTGGTGLGKGRRRRAGSIQAIERREMPRYFTSREDEEMYAEQRREETRYEDELTRKKQKNTPMVDFDDENDSLEKAYKQAKGLNRNNERKSILDKLFEAGTIGGKTKVIMENINDLAKKPATIIASIMGKADTRIYDFMFGEDGADPEESFMGRMTRKMHSTFEHINTYIDENILDPLKNKLGDHPIKDFLKNSLGIDIDEIKSEFMKTFVGEKDSNGTRSGGIFGDFIQKTKDAMGEYLKLGGGAIKETLTPVYNSVLRRATTATRPRDDGTARVRPVTFTSNGNASYDDAVNALSSRTQEEEPGDYLDAQYDNPETPIQGAARGGKVTKTGVIAVTGGEYIIPAPGNKKQQLAKENIAKGKFLRYYGNNYNDFGNYAEGGPVINGTLSEEQTPESKGKQIGTRINNGIVTALDDLRNTIIGDDSEKKKAGTVAQKTMEDAFKFAPNMVAGGLLGGGFSLLTGMVGGPMLGAAIGAGTALISKSETVQKALFGEIGEYGKRDGSGLLSKDITKFIQEKFPTIAKTGLTGSALGFLNLVPGGAVGGMVLGSALGYVQQSDTVKEYLFGPDGLAPDLDKKIKKNATAMGLGSVVGAIGGPFGLTTNIILGALGGYVSQTDKFKKLMFGDEDEDGKRKGGLKGWLFTQVFDPAKEGIKDITRSVKARVEDFFENKKNGLKHLAKSAVRRLVGSAIGHFFRWLKGTRLGKAVGKVGKFAGGVAKKAFKAINPLTAPSRILRGIGRHMTKNDIIKGRATGMSAAERLDYMNSNAGYGNLDAYRNSGFLDSDIRISQMSPEQIEQLSGAAHTLKGAANTKELERVKVKISGNLISSCKKLGMDPYQINMVKRAMENPDKDAGKASYDKLISKLNLPADQRAKLDKAFDEASEKTSRFNQGAETARSGYEDAKRAFENALGTGPLSDKDFARLQNTVIAEHNANLRQDDKNNSRTDEDGTNKSNEILAEQLNEVKTISDAIKDIIDQLKRINNPNSESDQDETSTSNDGTGEVTPDGNTAPRDIRNAMENNSSSENPLSNDGQNDPDDVTNNAFGGRPASKLIAVTKGERILNYANGGATNPIIFAINRIANILERKFSRPEVVHTSDGKIIKMKTDRDGDTTYDTQDSDTVNTLREIEAKNNTQENIASSLKTGVGFFDKLKGLFGGDKDEDGEDGEGSGGLLSKLSGLFKGLLTPKNILGLGGSLLMFGGGLDKTFSNLTDTVGQMFGYDKTDIGLSGENGEAGLASQTKNWATRNLLKGDRMSRMYKHIPGQKITAKGFGLAEKGIGAGKNKLAKVFANSKLGGKIMDSKLGKLIIDKSRKGAAKKAEKEAAKAAAKGGVKGAAKGGIKDQIADAVMKWVNKIRKKVPDAAQGALDDAAEKIINEASDVASKKGGETIAESTARNASDAIPFLNIGITLVFAVIDFTTGYQDASSILGVEDPTTGERVIAGLIKSLNGAIPFVGGLIPEKWIVNVFCETVGKSLGINEKRQDFTDKVNAYNKENGTDYSKEEYNKTVKNQKTWTENAGSLFGDIGSGFKSLFKGGSFAEGYEQSKETKRSGVDEDGNLIAGYINENTWRWKVYYKKLIKKGMPRDYAEALYLNECLHDSKYKLTDERIADMESRVQKYSMKKGAYKMPPLEKDYKHLIDPVNAFDSASAFWRAKDLKKDFADVYGKNGSITKSINDSKGIKTETPTTTSGSGTVASTVTSSTADLTKDIGETESTKASGAGSGLISGGDSGFSKGNKKKRNTSKIKDKFSTFISQRDAAYAQESFANSNIQEKGCGPAVAAMVSNSLSDRKLSMEEAAKFASAKGYTDKNGTTSDYFKDVLGSRGIDTKYIENKNGSNSSRIMSGIKSGDVILLGQDKNNKSKADSPFGPNAHYVVAKGFDKAGRVIIDDPESNKPGKRYTKDILKGVKLGIATKPKKASASGSGLRRALDIVRKYSGSGTPNTDYRSTIWAFLKNNGFTDISAAAVLGNMMQEAGYNCEPTIIQGGTYGDLDISTMGGTKGYGICQWTYQSRQQGLLDYCTSNNLDYHTIDAQLNYFLYEANTNYSTLIPEMNKCTDLSSAVTKFCNIFEGAGIPEITKRVEYATQCYNEFSGKTIDNTVTTVNGSITTTTGDESEETPSNNKLDQISNKMSSAFSTMGKSLFGDAFDKLGTALGFTNSTDDETTTEEGSTTASSSDTDAIASGDGTVAQKVADIARSKIGQIPTYSTDASKRTDIDNGTSDCSGFAQYCLTSAGGPDPGSYTGAQIENGTEVDRGTTPEVNKLQPGDLMFFKSSTNNGRPDNVGHVEVYVGNNQCIGNGSSGGAHLHNATEYGETRGSGKGYISSRRYVDSAAGSGLLDGSVYSIGGRRRSSVFTGNNYTGSGAGSDISLYSEPVSVASASSNSRRDEFVSQIKSASKSSSDILIESLQLIVKKLSNISSNTNSNVKIYELLIKYLKNKSSSTSVNTASISSDRLNNEDKELIKELQKQLDILATE